MENYLIQLKEECPQLLIDHQPGQHIDIQEILKERILYYPGSGFDGQPIKTFNIAHAVHVYLYVDYLLTMEELKRVLSLDGFRGYHLLDTQRISETDLAPHGWRPHVEIQRHTIFNRTAPYCFMNIYERDADYDDSHGGLRFAVIFLCADGHATYDAIFANYFHEKAPFVVVLQDHGFGGNYSRFGNGGLMHKVAKTANVFPEYLLVADDTDCWEHYHKVSTKSVVGGMHHNSRHLYQRDKNPSFLKI